MSLIAADFHFLQRAQQLAEMGLGYAYPNPMVGAVIVHNQVIIGEGYHQKAGEAHAEINAIQQVKDKKLLRDSILYVSLEPCTHVGRTPACTKAILDYSIPKVVIDEIDPNPIVNSSGVSFLKSQGVEVIVQPKKPIQQSINKRFFTFHTQRRPYIILKWAQSSDGFIDGNAKNPIQITNPYSQQLSHKWRTEENAILIGKNTLLKDNPRLNARYWKGSENLKFALDPKSEAPNDWLLGKEKNVNIFTQQTQKFQNNVNYIQLNFEESLPQQILSKMYELEIQSVIIEGGRQTLQMFIDEDFWDEARVFTNPTLKISKGTAAPNLKNHSLKQSQHIKGDLLQHFIHV